jgi:CubicO group peptidase (beta-lactamase class C family)
MFKKRLISVTLALIMILTTAVSVSASPALGTETAVESAALIADAIVNAYGAASIQYAFITDGEIVISGTASASAEEEVTENTMYGIGSLSKTYAATAIMQLVDDGKVGLDTPITEYIPEFKMKDERYKDITVRMLLNHSSGIGGSTLGSAFLYDTYNEKYKNDFLEALAEQNLKADPGAFSVHCNDGFTLAEIVVERVSGMNFSEYLEKNILSPIGGGNTKTPVDDFDRSALAATYANGKRTPADAISAIGAGGIYSTAHDLVKFAQVFMVDSNGLLSKESVDAMAAYEFERGIWPELADSIFDYGLGWDSVRLFPFNRYNIQALVKGGDTQLYHAALVVLPEYNMAAAVVMSGGGSMFAAGMASNVLLDLLLEKNKINEILPDVEFEETSPVLIPSDYEKYFGYYAIGMDIVQLVKNKEGNALLATNLAAPGASETIPYIGDGVFMLSNLESGLTAIIKFVEEENGKTYVWTRTYLAMPYLGQFALSEYTHQKIEIGSLDEDIIKVWAERNNKKYLVVSEPYNSQFYGSGGIDGIEISYFEELTDYLFSNKIVDADTAVNILQIPVMNGRDSADFLFYRDSGAEHLSWSSYTFIDSTSVSDLDPGSSSYLTINDSGESRWHSIGKEAAGKIITVTMSEKSAFAVYDEGFNCVYHSYIDKGNSAILPENGMVVFIGAAKAVFDIQLSNNPANDPSDWAQADVADAISTGLVPPGMQSAYREPTTRAEFAALAVTLYEKATGGEIAERVTFTDTDDENVEKAAAINVVNGVGENMFAPNDPITREQAATMLARIADALGQPLTKTEPTFADTSDISSYALVSVGQMQTSGVMNGTGNNTFSPNGDCTREQSIITVLRLYKMITSLEK